MSGFSAMSHGKNVRDDYKRALYFAVTSLFTVAYSNILPAQQSVHGMVSCQYLVSL